MKRRFGLDRFHCITDISICDMTLYINHFIVDNFIKVWRLYPFAQEALAPLMEPLFCAQTPIHMTMLKTNLCVALQQETTATYCVVIYNLKDRSKSSIISILVLTVISQYSWNTLKSLIKLNFSYLSVLSILLLFCFKMY